MTLLAVQLEPKFHDFGLLGIPGAHNPQVTPGDGALYSLRAVAMIAALAVGDNAFETGGKAG